jgi:hypothetical protein
VIKFRVTPDGEDPYEIEAMARDVLMWERTTGGVMSTLANQQSMADMYGLAYFASRRLKLFVGTAREFEGTCDIEPLADDEGEDVNPTRPAP